MFRATLLFALLLNSCSALAQIVQLISVAPETRDFFQDYLAAKAIADGLDPYAPVATLADFYEHPILEPTFPHPTPHPPPALLLVLPLSQARFKHASFAWLLVELLCLGVGFYLLLLTIGRSSVLLTSLLSLVSVGWHPVWHELAQGQLGLLLFLLLSGFMLSVTCHHGRIAGLLLGSAIALKLLVWPIAFYFLIRKKWSALVATGATLFAWNIIAAAVLGFSSIRDYYLLVGPQVATLYRAHETNSSLWSLGWRLFDGTGSSVVAGMIAPGAIFLPGIARWVSIVACLSAFLLGIHFANQTSDQKTPIAILVCLSLMISPVTWIHYLVIVIIPLMFLTEDLKAIQISPRTEWLLLGSLVLIWIPQYRVREFVLSFVGEETPSGAVHVPFFATLPSLLPLLLIAILVLFLWRFRQDSLPRVM